MTAGTDTEAIDESAEQERQRPRSLSGVLRGLARALTFGGFSSLTRRILLLNLAGLIVLVVAILILNQQRASLIDSEVRSLTAQGELIANSIAASATSAPNPAEVFRDPGALPGDLEAAADFIAGMMGQEFAIDPTRAGPLVRSYLSTSAGPRVRVYDPDGERIVDSDFSEIFRRDLPPPGQEPSLLERAWDGITAWFRRNDLPIYRELGPSDGLQYEEVETALNGEATSLTRVTPNGELIVSVAIPIQDYVSVLGVVLLTTREGDIDNILREERNAILRVFAVAASVSAVLSFLLAGTIAAPLRRLSAAAERVRKGVRSSRPQIPDFSRRGDEIGDLSQALREMTNSLYDRIDAIESFAADVSHELKNPLTSLRSAVETLPLAKTPESQKRLAEVIQHDVRRLDRLISDISDASRLDAELSRRDAEEVDLVKLLTALVSLSNETAEDGQARVELDVAPGGEEYLVAGHDIRLSQVMNNLIDNARSFSPADGVVRIKVRRHNGMVDVHVEDQGPGIRAEQFERIFERFYTDRPDGESFGQNSGLGLSITRQIVEAHGGRVRAENITKPDGSVAGARFIVRLPRAKA